MNSIPEISYLRARDPSVNHYALNRFSYCKVAKRLEPLLDETCESTRIPLEQPEDNYIKIYLRIKGGCDDEKCYTVDDNCLSCIAPDGSQALRKDARNVNGKTIIRKYHFSKVFDHCTPQTQLFDEIVRPKIFGLIHGFNSTLLTYGASGSGKTYTIVGTSSEPGIIPRALEYLFRSLPELHDKPMVKPSMSGDKVVYLDAREQAAVIAAREHLLKSITSAPGSDVHVKSYRAMAKRLSKESVAELDLNSIKNVHVSVWISFAEIYNEQIFDLLESSVGGATRKRLRLGSGPNNQAFVRGLKQVNVSCGLDAYRILNYGLTNLNYAETALNSHSSRSHCIFSIRLAQAKIKANNDCVSIFHFCDLAGAERLKKTGNVGDRLKESNNINTSLMVLGRCMKQVRDNQKLKNIDKLPVPFRESKLTQHFQRALSGDEDISMIVNINPIQYVFDETQHVLQFASIAREVSIIVPKSKQTRTSLFSDYCSGVNETLGMSDDDIRERIDFALQHQRQQLEKEHEYSMSAIIAQCGKELAKMTTKLNRQINDQYIEINALKGELLQRKGRLNSSLDSSVILISDDNESDEEGAMKGEQLQRVTAERDDLLKENEELRSEITKLKYILSDAKEQFENQSAIVDALEERLVVLDDSIDYMNSASIANINCFDSDHSSDTEQHDRPETVISGERMYSRQTFVAETAAPDDNGIDEYSAQFPEAVLANAQTYNRQTFVAITNMNGLRDDDSGKLLKSDDESFTNFEKLCEELQTPDPESVITTNSTFNMSYEGILYNSNMTSLRDDKEEQLPATEAVETEEKIQS